MRFVALFALFALAPASGWAQEKTVTYEKDIEPIFAKRCIACHSGDVKKGRLDLDSYETLVKGGKRGTAIVPGKSREQSALQGDQPNWSSRHAAQGRGTGDLGGRLSLVKLWIDQGAKAPTGKRERPKVTV